MILAQNWPKTAKSSWHCSFKELKKKNYFNIKAHYNFKLTLSFFRFALREAKGTGKFILHRVGTLGPHFGTYGLVTMFYREGLDSSNMAFIDRVQNGKQVSRFCLDHSHTRNREETEE